MQMFNVQSKTNRSQFSLLHEQNFTLQNSTSNMENCIENEQ